MTITHITKRDGRVVPFDADRIARALRLCFHGIGAQPRVPIDQLTSNAVNVLHARTNGTIPSVEGIQDIVEMVLQSAGEFDAAKHYILYRAERTKERTERPVPEDVRRAFNESDAYFPSPIQKFQFFDKYSRFNYDLGRRETWVETVDRTINFLYELAGSRLTSETYRHLRRMILEMRAMPSMRLLAMAGPAARRSNITIYNCSYLPIESIDAFVEALIISMSGCGVGYSVERQYVENFPRIRRQTGFLPVHFHVEDTAEGWADALRFGLEQWMDGGDVFFDLSSLRPAGTPLRTKGGRASGPAPFRSMLTFVRDRILSRQGSFLRPIDAHDIACAIGNASISGGVRRTAMIALFDHDDSQMRHCKNGDFERDNNQRWNANNSAVWPSSGLSQTDFIQHFLEMVGSHRGEPGIFNRESANTMRPHRRERAVFGINPCGEVLLRPWQFCNLSSAIARADDTYGTLVEKVEAATIIGTIQSMATNFPGLRPMWKNNCDTERLLGVDITGQMDCPVVQDAGILERLRGVAIETNRRFAPRLDINQSAAITCVKPSGNSSELLGCSSGIHARWAPYYIRNVRVSAHSPLFRVLRSAGVPMSPENGQTVDTATTWVIHFPVKAPDGAVTRSGRSAVEQCEYWLRNKLHWTEHNPSCTITYRPDEVIDLMKWVWEYRTLIGGLSFLPSSDAHYDQMPYVEVSREEYERMSASFPSIDWSKIFRYEEHDMTTASQELACFAGGCDLSVGSQ
jgi:ribonucleoside-diphosphate reductase alpha chain